MKEVHTKIQKALAEDYVNEQFRIQREEVDKMIEKSTITINPFYSVVQK